MSNPNRPPQQSYGCPNPACDYYLKRRTVSLAHLGQGLYGKPVQVVCECGTAVLPVFVTPIPYTIPEPEESGSVPPRPRATTFEPDGTFDMVDGLRVYRDRPRATRSPGADQPREDRE